MSTREACDRMRKKLLYLGYQMNYHVPGTDEDEDLKPHEVCFKRLNKWVQDHGTVKKHVNKMNQQELRKTVSQFEKVYKSFLSKTPANLNE